MPKITVSPGGRRGKRFPSRRVYVKLYEVVGDGKQSVNSASFTVYGVTVQWLESKIRGSIAGWGELEPVFTTLREASDRRVPSGISESESEAKR